MKTFCRDIYVKFMFALDTEVYFQLTGKRWLMTSTRDTVDSFTNAAASCSFLLPNKLAEVITRLDYFREMSGYNLCRDTDCPE
jgi:hypothetical protein